MNTDSTTDSMTALAAAWLRMWNGETDLTAEILTDDFRIHLGAPLNPDVADAVRGPAGMTALVQNFRRARPGIVFSPAGPLVGAEPHIAFLWHADTGSGRLSGIDLAVVVGDRIAEVWSVTGSRELPTVGD